MQSQKPEKLDFNSEYPCPCRRRGRLVPITLTEAFGCDRCQQIFVVEDNGFVLEQLFYYLSLQTRLALDRFKLASCPSAFRRKLSAGSAWHYFRASDYMVAISTTIGKWFKYNRLGNGGSTIGNFTRTDGLAYLQTLIQ